MQVFITLVTEELTIMELILKVNLLYNVSHETFEMRKNEKFYFKRTF